jgi:hypothetical protein
MICISFNVMGCSTNEYKIPTLANVDIKIHNPVWISPICGKKNEEKQTRVYALKIMLN